MVSKNSHKEVRPLKKSALSGLLPDLQLRFPIYRNFENFPGLKFNLYFLISGSLQVFFLLGFFLFITQGFTYFV